MTRLNYWRMAASVATGLFVFSALLFGMLAQQYGFMRDLAVRQQTNIINEQSVVIQKQAATLRQLQKLLFGNNETEQKPFPPGAPI